MTSIHCPRCGYTDDQQDYVLTELEQNIIRTLREVRKSPLSPVSSQLLADLMGYSRDAIQYHLTNMHKRGIVSLPHGRCSGWVEGDVLRELAQIIAGSSHIV